VSPPPGFDEIQRQEMARLFGLFAKGRLVLIPVLVAFFAWVLAHDHTPWRIWLLAAATPFLTSFFVWEFRRYRRIGLSAHAIDRNLAVGVLGSLLIAAASGGLRSPFLYVALPLSIAIGLFATPSLASWLVLLQGATVAAFAAAELAPGGPLLGLAAFGAADPAGRVISHALVLALLLFGGRYIGRLVRRAFDAMLRRAVAARAESLKAHAERAEELTALSAEIAHELKNPLASVKGLSGLLSQQLPDGKGAERLGVLRHEVDRMQAILDEFLNFSRPLVPLALGAHDLAALCREVAALHEGMAQERGLSLEVQGERALARCDPRKVKQILINLVQNALDASPPGATVSLQARAGDGAGQVRVLDRGRGVAPAMLETAFEPGVTTKPSGSGIGLTIARALARQHGGDLRLAARDGGGAVAVLTLPAPPAETGRGAAA
jgi:signal transduction histidine kinase